MPSSPPSVGDHEVVDDERRAGRAVVLARIAISTSQSVVREAVQGEQLGVVGDHEDAVADYGHAAIDAAAASPARPVERERL